MSKPNELTQAGQERYFYLVKTLAHKSVKRPPVERYRLTPRAVAALREAEDPKTKWKSFDTAEELMADLESHAKNFKK